MILIGFLVFGILFGQSCGEFQDSWRSCLTSKDCLVLANECGFNTGYNKKSLRKVLKYNACVGESIDCAAGGKQPKAKPECVKNRCEVVVVASAPEETKRPELPRSCKEDKDCAMAMIFSCCEQVPLRKDRVKDFEKQIKHLQTKECITVNCAMVQQWPVCRQGLCSSSSKKP